MSMELRVGKKYRLGPKIGSGTFGDVYRGTEVNTGEGVAIKLESLKTYFPQLRYESEIYQLFNKKGLVGIPKIHWAGIEGDFQVMVIDLLGPSLQDLFEQCGRHFSLKTVLMLADQLLARLEDLQSQSLIHRSIKPHNLVVGLEGSEQEKVIHLIDFGKAKKYRDPDTLKHIPYREKQSLTQREQFSSVNAHIGIEQSRRDDLESLGYVLVYFLLGSLPWDNIVEYTRKKKKAKVMDCKLKISHAKLCEGCPKEFETYFEYCRSLRFADEPDYAYLKRLFREVFDRNGFEDDHTFDWNVVKDEQSKSVPTSAPDPPAESEVVAPLDTTSTS